MTIEVRRKGKVDIVDFSGTLTIGNSADIRERFKSLVHDGGMFIFNMQNVTYMDSAGLGETAACCMRAAEVEGVIKLVVAPGGKVEQVLKITRLDRAFEVFHDEEEALASFIR
jgi:anti-anti-sigma factor